MGPRRGGRGDLKYGNEEAHGKITLRWGHAEEGVETSNGMLHGGAMYHLRWVHAVEGVETRARGEAEAVAKTLRWGHAVEGVETPDGNMPFSR